MLNKKSTIMLLRSENLLHTLRMKGIIIFLIKHIMVNCSCFSFFQFLPHILTSSLSVSLSISPPIRASHGRISSTKHLLHPWSPPTALPPLRRTSTAAPFLLHRAAPHGPSPAQPWLRCCHAMGGAAPSGSNPASAPATLLAA